MIEYRTMNPSISYHMIHRHLVWTLLCVANFAWFSTAIQTQEPLHIQVHAGDINRSQSLATFELKDVSPGVYQLKTDSGETEPLQVGPDQIARFLVRNLPSTQARRYTLDPLAPRKPDGAVTAKLNYKKAEFEKNGRRVLEYQGPAGELPRPGIGDLYIRGGYIHPVVSPSGIRVTEDFPARHTHHHGIWFPWTRTQFQGRNPDFWNMGAGKGKVEFLYFGDTASGPVWGGLKATHRFVDMTSTPHQIALNETWDIRVLALDGYEKPVSIFDLVSRQECAGKDPLILPEYHYGGLGVRGRDEWDGAANCHFLTSNGETDRIKAHATRAKWCHMGGQVNGEWTGIAILSHPDNYRFPQPMRVHPTEPFFCFAPQQAGDMSIEPGETYVSQYRFLVTDGKPDAALIEKVWQDYAYPVDIQVSKSN